MFFVALLLANSITSTNENSEIYQELRKNCRRGIIEKAVTFQKATAEPQPNDRVENLIDSPQNLIRSLKEMETRKWQSAKLKQKPWSDSYWPIASGMLGYRYAEENFPHLDWKAAKEYVTQNGVPYYLENNLTHLLSPSEKYDLLTNSSNQSLTQTMWQEGQKYFNRYRAVESWMGLCHGWAVASYSMPEPKKTVQLNLANTSSLTFYPSDIKGLVTLLYAKGYFNTRFIGGRCDIKDPASDEERVQQQECLDSNPGTWHMAVVHQIANAQKSFVMDASFDYEVWNHPVYGYNYSYFHVQSQEETSDLESAFVEVKNFQEDPHKKYRSKKAKYVVGIVMNVTYITENSPSHEEDQTSIASYSRYVYDLELDVNFQIVGGEWHQKFHPDFLWTINSNELPLVAGSSLVGNREWTPSMNYNDTWNNAVTMSSSQSQPLPAIVKKLVKMSSQTQ